MFQIKLRLNTSLGENLTCNPKSNPHHVKTYLLCGIGRVSSMLNMDG
ncbi:Uncharacterised protein [Serratia quinivorans]|nr:Uncharacterised protein [Serratia quinivorans]